MRSAQTNIPPNLQDEQDQVELFNYLLANFQKVQKSGEGGSEHFYTLGSHTIRLLFANDALVPRITPALEHIATESENRPSLTIFLWDKASDPKPPLLLETLMGALRWHWWEFADGRGEIANYSGGRFRIAIHPGPNVFSMLDTQQNLAHYWINDAAELPWSEAGSPLKIIFNWWTSLKGYQFVHAGAVGEGSERVLLAGKSGVGKSTTALACFNAGMTYVSDDYALISTASQPEVYSLYNTAKLKGATDLKRFPNLAPLLFDANFGESEKAMVFLHEHFPEKIATRFAIKAILLPKVTGDSQTVLKSTSPAAALAALAPSTLIQLPGSGSASLHQMAKLVQQVPCYVLEVGTALATIPEAISRLLNG